MEYTGLLRSRCSTANADAEISMKIKILTGLLALFAVSAPSLTRSGEPLNLAAKLLEIDVLITEVHKPPGADGNQEVLELDAQYQLTLYRWSDGKYTADLLSSSGTRLYAGLFVRTLNCNDSPTTWPAAATGQLLASPPADCVLRIGTADLTITTKVLAPPPYIQITVAKEDVPSPLTIGQTYTLYVSAWRDGYRGDVYDAAGNRLYGDVSVDTTNCQDSSKHWPTTTRGVVTYGNATPPDCAVRAHLGGGLVLTGKIDPQHTIGEGLPWNPLTVPKKAAMPTS
jgi:hypothetical protein